MSKPTVLIAHGPGDADFVHGLVSRLNRFGWNANGADWSVRDPDTILPIADETLVVVVSAESIASRWVKGLDSKSLLELDPSRAKVLIILRDGCERPEHLVSIRCADYSDGIVLGDSRLWGELAYGHWYWETLSHLAGLFSQLSEKLLRADCLQRADELGNELHSILYSTFSLRLDIEAKRVFHDLKPRQQAEPWDEQKHDSKWDTFYAWRANLAADMGAMHREVDRCVRLVSPAVGPSHESPPQECREAIKVLKLGVSRVCFDSPEEDACP